MCVTDGVDRVGEVPRPLDESAVQHGDVEVGQRRWLGRSKRRIGVLRNVVGGALAMAITYGIGSLVGTAV